MKKKKKYILSSEAANLTVFPDHICMDPAYPETTPHRKRKADDEENSRKSDHKKTKSTYTPRTQATKQLRRKTPSRTVANRTTMSEQKDKTDKSSERPVMMNELKDCLSDWTGRLSDSLTKKLTTGLSRDFSEAVSVVANSVAKNSKQIDELTLSIKRIENDAAGSNSKLEQKIDRLESVFLASKRASCGENSPSANAPPVLDLMQVDLKVRERNMNESEKYSTSRKSIRLWPVRGVSDDDIRVSTLNFIRQKLEITPELMEDSRIVRVRRSRPPRQSRVKFEVLVTFDDKFTRDMISAHGKNLADFIDASGYPTAGIRLDYPAHLGASFRTLDWYGKEMRDRHGKGTRRNIKFDDDEESLYLDICLPDEEYWHRITPEVARRFKQQVEQERTSRSRKFLECSIRQGPSSGTIPPVPSTSRNIFTKTPSVSLMDEDGYISPERRK